MADKITVLLVDDHALVRRGFRRLLEDDSDIAVVGEGSTGDEAIKLAKELMDRRIRGQVTGDREQVLVPSTEYQVPS